MLLKRIGLLLLMAAVVFLSRHYYLKAQTSHKSIDNIHYLNAIESFILTSQKTRGLTNSYLNGNLSAQLLVYGQRDKMAQAIKDMETYQDKSLLHVIQQKQLVLEILQLNKTAFKEDPKTVFSHYTKIIDGAINFGQKLEEKMVQNDTRYKAISTITFPLIENIAKLRGLGSGCVAHGNSTQVENKKLLSFIMQINKLQYSMGRNSVNSPAEKEAMEDIVYSIQRYVQLSQDEVINRNAITIGADFYFDQGTAVIDTIVKYLDGKQAEKISSLNHQSNKDSTIALALIAVFIIPLVFIARWLGV